MKPSIGTVRPGFVGLGRLRASETFSVAAAERHIISQLLLFGPLILLASKRYAESDGGTGLESMTSRSRLVQIPGA